jgi:phosphatidylserine/phosphatidylglycerophosphate/cardiolipin synthase-like enzyme
MFQSTLRRVTPFIVATMLLAGCIFPDAPPALPPIGVPIGSTPQTPAIAGAQDVQLIVLPDDGETVIVDRIAEARERVYMKIYLLADLKVFDSLKRAKANGADVRVMIEEDPLGGSDAARAAFGRLKRMDIDVKYASPAFRFTHEKSYVIDDSVIIMTANATRTSVTRNREFGIVRDDAGDVNEVIKAFNDDWSRAVFRPKSSTLVWSPVNSRDRITALIRSATRTLDVYAASTRDNGILEEMAEAEKRGVKVRVLISPPRGEDAENESEEDLDYLQRNGIELRMLKTPYIHAKVFVADESLAFVGSVNITTTSLELNRELGILVSDASALRRLMRTFKDDWSKAAER